MKKSIEIIHVNDEELKRIKEEVERSSLSDLSKKIILNILDSYYWLYKMFQLKKMTIGKLRRMLGFKTEKEKKTKDKEEKDKEDKEENKPPTNTDDAKDGKIDDNKNKGNQGRNGQGDMPGAEHVFHPIEDLKGGDRCPECEVGKVYPVQPGIQVQFKGQSPIQTTIHEKEKLRCNACGEYFEAKLADCPKYHPSADVSIVIQKYAMGLPFNRIATWQEYLGVPFPSSTLWERCEALLESVHPVYQKLLEVAKEGSLFHGDDTRNKILDFQKQLKETNSKRVGVYTTGIISKTQNHTINLFFTSGNYCGENLKKLLNDRLSEKKIIYMSDALKMNLPKGILLDWANCLTHARRNFWDLRDEYPRMINYIIKEVAKIYYIDSKTKTMTLEARMLYHQKHSSYIMEKLKRWGLKKIYLKKIEPNEELGGALKYFFNHFQEITLFLRLPGVPLDNNAVERLLKAPIRNRKASYFFKTLFGAFVSDVMLSLIETCKSTMANPFKYLIALHENAKLVKKFPELWLPWNYLKNIQFT